MDSIKEEIAKRYGQLPANDIDFAFEIYTPDQTDNWKRPTKKQILRPIQLWFNRRIKIQNDVNEFLQGELDRMEREANILQYESEALCIYRESVREHVEAVKEGVNGDGLNSWKGNIYQAQRIASKFLYWQLDEGTRHMVRERFRERYYQLKCASESGKLSEVTADIIIFSDSKEMRKRILSDECCIEAVRIGIEPKEQI